MERLLRGPTQFAGKKPSSVRKPSTAMSSARTIAQSNPVANSATSSAHKLRHVSRALSSLPTPARVALIHDVLKFRPHAKRRTWHHSSRGASRVSASASSAEASASTEEAPQTPPRGNPMQVARSVALLVLPLPVILLAMGARYGFQGVPSMALGAFSSISAFASGMASWSVGKCLERDLLACFALYALLYSGVVGRGVTRWCLYVAEERKKKLRARRARLNDPCLGMEWRWYWFKVAGEPLAMVAQVLLLSVLVLSVVHALETDVHIAVPKFLGWLDDNKDGMLSCSDAEAMVVRFVSHLVNIVVGISFRNWLVAAKHPPKAPPMDPPNAQAERCTSNFIIDRYFFNLLRMRNNELCWEERAKAGLVDRLLSVIAFLSATLPVLSLAGIGVSSILAFGGISGLALGFASQAMVGNAIAGLLLMVNRPFMEGDKIIFGGKIEGKVLNIGWHSTTLHSEKDGLPRVVPNKNLSESMVINKSRRTYRTIRDTFDITLGSYSRLEHLVHTISHHVQTDPELLREPGYVNDNTGCIFLGTSEGGAMRIQVTAFTKPTLSSAAFTKVKSRVLLDLVNTILASGGQIMLPMLCSPADIRNENSRATMEEASGLGGELGTLAGNGRV